MNTLLLRAAPTLTLPRSRGREWEGVRGTIVSLCIGFQFLLCAAAFAAEPCAPDNVLYTSIEPMREPLGLHGEDRKQYLDRRYARWQDDDQSVIQPGATGDAKDDVLKVSVTEPDGLTLERVEVVIEAQ